MATIKQKPSGRWEAVVEAGRGPNGQRQQLRRRFATKRQAKLGAAQLEVEAAAAATAAGDSPTLSSYCDWWLAGRRGNLAPKTFASYECVFRNHVAGDLIGKVVSSVDFEAHDTEVNLDGFVSLSHYGQQKLYVVDPFDYFE
mgnify:CR=1 FL=1